jgi:nucleoid DNA-binding protein
MDKHELAQRLARRSRQSKGSAADRVDALVYKLLKDLKQPKPVIPARAKRDGNVPGLSAPVKES